VEPNRERLREIIGAVDARTPSRLSGVTLADEFLVTNKQYGHLHAFTANPISWDVLDGVTGEGLALYSNKQEKEDAKAPIVVVVPDPDQTPEVLVGMTPVLPPEFQIARQLAENGCHVVVPALINRADTYSGHPDIRYTNMSHREYIYRMSFEMGRHIVGYEVQKVLAAFEAITHQLGDRPLAVVGIGEGGLIALCAAALEPRIDACLVCGYFQERERVWTEPIYRNVWSQLTEFGDAEIASLIAPRTLVIEACAPPEIAGPPAVGEGRSTVAAPGRIVRPDDESVRHEVERCVAHYKQLSASEHLVLVESKGKHAGANEAVKPLLAALGQSDLDPPARLVGAESSSEYIDQRQQRQVDELNRFTQTLLHRSDKARDKLWANVDRSSVDKCVASLEAYRDMVYDQMIGRLPEPTVLLNPRTRKVIDEETHVGYEVVLDCYPAGDTERPIPDGADVKIPDTGSVDRIGWAVGKDWGVIAGGILLLPKDLKQGERRPVVVCQHGLEGVPMDTIDTDPNAKGYGPYKGFSTALVKRGFIVYVPQNPYRGHDAFRVIQRKSNPMGRSLFSYIIPQHARTLEWLASLPYVDPDRMAFYGLSYGGKTAVRVPPMLPPREGKPGYCLSICSADFNEWVRKNASSEDRYSYVYTGEYEIFEWNMGHVANYAELSYLMTPRPFMVERGHDDGVAPDEWVAWEYAKVQRHYDRLGLGDRTELEVFNGPHTINGVGTYAFLHKHLNWPER
jgi:dienelactone hydrolase